MDAHVPQLEVRLGLYEALFVALICELDKEAVSRVYSKAYEYATNEATKKDIQSFFGTVIDNHYRP